MRAKEKHKHTKKNDKEKGNRNNKIPRSEKDNRGAFNREREFGIVPAASHPIPSPARNHAPKKTRSIYHIPYSKGFSFTNGTIDVA